MGRLGELLDVRIVVLARFDVGDGHPAQRTWDLLHLARQHLALDEPPEIVQRHPFLLLQHLDELFVGIDAVVFLQGVEVVLELVIRELVAELPAALDEQQLFHRRREHAGRHLLDELHQLGVRGRLDAAGPDGRDLALLQVALRDDLPVHLHQDPLDDPQGRIGVGRDRRLGGRRRAGAQQRRRDQERTLAVNDLRTSFTPMNRAARVLS